MVSLGEKKKEFWEDKIIMIKLRKAAAMLLCVTTFTTGLTATASDVTVEMNAVRGNGSENVSFLAASPVMLNDALFVPARSLADHAGMEISWDQSAKTAILSIKLDDGADTPLKQYGLDLINKVSGYGLELSPKSISAALKAGGKNAMLRFTFTDSEGDEVAIGKSIELSSAPRVINDKTLMTPLRDTVSIFGLDVDWDQKNLLATISIPEHTVVPKNMSIVPVHTSIGNKSNNNVYSEEVSEDAPVAENNGTYLGRFKITHYCTCNVCNGGWGNNTAYAGKITPGQTIAVDPDIIAPLSWVYIEDYGLRRAEDCGGGINNYHIDMAVSSHSEAYRLGVVYKDVWLQ